MGTTDDVAAVRAVLLRYAKAVDTRDWDLLLTCFTEDADLDYDTSGHHANPAAFVTNALRIEGILDGTQHFVTNEEIEVNGDDATSAAYVLAQHSVPGHDDAFMLGGIYRDQLTRAAGAWRISSRRFVRLWTSGPALDLHPPA